MRVNTGMAAAAAAAALTLTAVVPGGAVAGASGGIRPGPLTWGRCPAAAVQEGKPPRQGRPGLECAALSVPLDYRHAGGRRISVEVSRLRTAKPGLRRGILVTNLGGPAPGLSSPVAIATLAPPSVLDRYDLVGFDPRGFGLSDPVTCHLTRKQLAGLGWLPWPLPGGVPQMAAVSRQVAAQCARYAGATLPFLTTANIARDLDQIRSALGADRISYLGYSYGSYLGAVYSSLFPGRTDRVVLDSTLDPAATWRQRFLRIAPHEQARMPDFTRWAAARNPVYRLGSTAGKVQHTYFQLTAALDRHPLATPSGRLDGRLLSTATLQALFNDANFTLLAKLWRAARERDAATAGTLATKAGLWQSIADPGLEAGLLAVYCDDTSWPHSIRRYQQDTAKYARRYPVAGAMAANVWPCAFWAHPAQPQVRVTGHGPAHILIVQNVRDPLGGKSGGVAMRKALHARLISVEQGGHGAYLLTPDTCANATATRYLTTGILPRHNLMCP
jgi:pimeloyl-ACP methyl ester carboxylesterase